MQVQHSILQEKAASIEEGVKLAEIPHRQRCSTEKTGRICRRDK